MPLQPHNNLVADSPLHRHLESLLVKHKGSLPAQLACEKVMLMRGLDEASAEALMATFIEGDPRFRLNGAATIEWNEPSPEEIWRSCRRFAVFDLETTNGGSSPPRIMEIGICLVEGGRIVDEWASLVNPKRSIPPYIRKLTGIKNADVRQAPPWEDVLPTVLDKVHDTILVAHHALFDYKCLNSEISRVLGQRLINRYLCTVELARRFLPGSDNYRLETLSRWLDLKHENPHRAGSDARATADLLCHMLRTAETPWSEFLRPKLHGTGDKKKAASARKRRSKSSA